LFRARQEELLWINVIAGNLDELSFLGENWLAPRIVCQATNSMTSDFGEGIRDQNRAAAFGVTIAL
jgi:hypothetical protein